MSHFYEGLFQEWEIRIAKKYVRQFRSTCQCLRRDFKDDLVDECLRHWHEVRSTVKPEAEDKRKAYMVRIVKNKLADIVRSRMSRKRNEFFQAVSLDQFLENNSDSPFLAHPTQQDPASQSDFAELTSKLDIIMKNLSPQQQQLCVFLRDGNNITEISAGLGISRVTVYKEIERIREVFEKEGVRKYLL